MTVFMRKYILFLLSFRHGYKLLLSNRSTVILGLPCVAKKTLWRWKIPLLRTHASIQCNHNRGRLWMTRALVMPKVPCPHTLRCALRCVASLVATSCRVVALRVAARCWLRVALRCVGHHVFYWWRVHIRCALRCVALRRVASKNRNMFLLAR